MDGMRHTLDVAGSTFILILFSTEETFAWREGECVCVCLSVSTFPCASGGSLSISELSYATLRYSV